MTNHDPGTRAIRVPFVTAGLLLLLPLLLLVGGPAALRAAGIIQTTLVSVSSDGIEGNRASQYPVISADGRYVAFQSLATNLVTGDTNDKTDIFVHDRQTGETTRVSVKSDGTEGNQNGQYPDISADGRFITFTSTSTNLVDDVSGEGDVFVHDRQTGETTLVSVSSNGTVGSTYSLISAISATGRYVAFWSNAINLVEGDTNNHDDVFVHDRQTGETTRVSIHTDGTQADRESNWYGLDISTDGRYVVFDSRATTLVDGHTGTWNDVFIHDRQTGETRLVSVMADGTQGNNHSNAPRISADGRFVVFESDASNFAPGDANWNSDVFLKDLQTGELTTLSVDATGAIGTFGSSSPVISDDGRIIAFSSSNDLTGDGSGPRGAYRYDRLTGEKQFISVSSAGVPGNNSSYPWGISAGGRYVVAYSTATDLVEGGTTSWENIFVFDTGPQGALLVSTLAAGRVDGLDYGPHDILMVDGDGWTKWFDGAAAGLLPDRRFKHNISATWISDTESADVLMSFSQNQQRIGTLGWVDGYDILHWDGDAFNRWFEGEQVGLNVKTQEKIDGLHVLPAAPHWSEFSGRTCQAYLLISTQGPGMVPKPGNPKPRNMLKFGGEDVLGFCATNLGTSTTGFWEMVLDGSALGVARNNIDGIAMRADGQQLYLTGQRQFSVGAALGSYSMVHVYDFGVEDFVDTIWSAFDNGMAPSTRLDALHVVDTPELR